ncbi:tRNA pseudouridine(55) synthase TruB [Arenimonas caeni]|jgi:tRNA pseudouridine55 synthase|uniref:tRNA pseudouridine(55) synthase TruB n=1 Tax=Arenimonas caeni TaxID=2058085 RepID=UPI002A369D2B|nr:tRNA pseudouridine(55) synthase TruB [Arenimonas caeni]MDY0021787.1 tRNA pseudouridine(55) synthase TruB [Arenimonas caeni]
MGRIAWRPVDGIVLLDKPAGMSSNAALQAVRRLYRAEKGGHTGALDPLATGLLPVCLGEATKIAGLLLAGRKAYEAGVVLGATTDTDDADGQVLRTRPVPALDRATVEAALQSFLGRIRQRPPIYSALKQGGEPLYAKARRGEAIEVPEREVEVEAIELLALDGDRLRLAVTCGSGTYIRSLARDLGEALGCGAHIASLRRTWVEPFDQPDMASLDQLEALAAAGGEAALDARLLPVDAGLARFPALVLDAAGAARVAHGQPVPSPGPVLETLNLVGPDGRSLGLGRRDEQGQAWPRRLFRWGSAA